MKINKSFIISLLINTIVLLIPVQSAINIISDKENTINVELKIVENANYLNDMSSGENQITDNSENSESFIENRNTEKNERQINEVSNVQSNKQREKNNIVKEVKIPSEIKLEENNILPDNKSINGSHENINTSNIINSNNVNNEGNSSSSNSNSQNIGNRGSKSNLGSSNSGGNSSTSINVCRENIDFKVSYNQELAYPLAAVRMGHKGDVRIEVKISLNSNGSVNVLSVTGGSNIFQQEARKAAKNIKINIINPESVKCILAKSFIFKSK